jgi:amino acid adenylation domain-containing protein
MTDTLPASSGSSIPRAALGAELPLSYAQEQVWFIDEFNSDSPMHNLPFLLRLRGPLDPAALSRALAALAARHEPLRTRLPAGGDGRPVQVVDPPEAAGLEVEDLSGLAPEHREPRLRELAVTTGARPIRFARDQLLRASLVRLASGDHALLVMAHQTGFDDGSTGVFVRELAALYREEAGGEPASLPELPVRFADYVLWEREHLSGQVLASLEAWWQGNLSAFETSQFPTDRPRPLLASHAGAVQARDTGAGLLAGLRELSAGGTLAETLLAALQVLLSRYTGQTDLVVGAVSANRDRPELAPLIGLLANPVPLRADLSGDPPFAELLGRVRAAMSSARAHQDLPFAKIVETLHLDRDTGRWPVYQIAFSCPDPVEEAQAAGVAFTAEPVERRAAKYDIEFVARAGADGLRIEATYAPALFDAATIERLLGHLEVLLRGAVADPAAPLSELPVLTGAELRRELTDWNDTALELPVTCIHQGFEACVAASPEAVAAEFEHQRVSYAELERQANQIARRLRELGAGPEVLAGVCLRTGLDRLAALLGIWKAGAGYVPLDPAAPAARLEYLIADTGMAVLLTDDVSAAGLPAGAVPVLNLDAERERIGALDDGPLADTGVTPASVAYVIYTSGSTGQPKGVVVEHRQAINFLHGMTRAWHIGPDSAVLSFAAVTFDVSVMDMFMPLLGGARVVLAAPETLHSPPRLAALIRDRHITFACLPPAVLTLLTGEDFPELRTLLSAGEELTSELLRAWLRPGLEIYNGYGPTEASIGATFMRLEPTTPLPPPIGRPKPNYQAYVLDAHLNPVPVGVTGELHIGGAGVARGYLHQPGLTMERFIPDPFRPGGRLYKTGDLARRRPDGTIAFVGRADNQVKIRGLRVELGEIETALLAHPAVAQAVATVVRDAAGQPQLAGYLRASEGSTPAVAQIRQHLAGRLPGYMVPTYLTVVAEFPLTAHGKVDKAALPAPQADTAGAAQVPPHTLMEVLLVDLYAGVLGTEEVGASDSFFDGGGSSLQAMQLITQLREYLDVDLDVASVFLTPTPQQLAALLRDKHGFDDEELADPRGWSAHVDGF